MTTTTDSLRALLRGDPRVFVTKFFDDVTQWGYTDGICQWGFELVESDANGDLIVSIEVHITDHWDDPEARESGPASAVFTLTALAGLREFSTVASAPRRDEDPIDWAASKLADLVPTMIDHLTEWGVPL